MDIVYENGYLKGKYDSLYWSKRTEVRKLLSNKEVKASVFVGLGAVISLSQIAEYVFGAVVDLKKVADGDITDEQLKNAFMSVMESFNSIDLSMEKQPSLGPALKNLLESQLINEVVFNSSKFINQNRNNFVHNYFINKPGALSNLDEMKELIHQIFYTIYSLNQLINEVYREFDEYIKSKRPLMQHYISKFKEMFIGEFNPKI